MSKTNYKHREAYVADFANHPELARVTVISETERMYITDRKHQHILGMTSLVYSSRITKKDQVFFTLAEAVAWLHQKAQENVTAVEKELEKAKNMAVEMQALEQAVNANPDKAEAIIQQLDKRR